MPDIPSLDSYPYLDQLLSGYLFSDYTIYGPDLADAVAAYASDGGWLDIVAARADIRRFLAVHRDDLEAELARRFPDHAQVPGQSASDYLDWLDRTLASHQAVWITVRQDGPGAGSAVPG